MKALSVLQPWASLIIAGAKRWEFRSWNPAERGPRYRAVIGQRIVIHASARPVNRDELTDLIHRLRAGDEWAASTCLETDKALQILEPLYHGNKDDLPLGAGNGTAVLGNPVDGDILARQIFGERDLDVELLPKLNDSDRDQHANWGWPMLDVQKWPSVLTATGQRGFWNWPLDEEAIARAVGFDEDHHIGQGRRGRSIHRSHKAEGRNFIG
jgi:hypothetical protein